MRRDVIYLLISEINISSIRHGEASNHTEEGCFPATARAEEGEELTPLDRKVHLVDRFQGTKPFGNLF